MRVKLIIVAVFLACLLSGILVLSSFRKTDLPPRGLAKPPKLPSTIDTVAAVYITRYEGNLYTTGEYVTQLFSDKCDVYEIIARDYMKSCIAIPDSVIRKIKRL